jgi:DNA repair exonuclease SbcCD nuclease subunit
MSHKIALISDIHFGCRGNSEKYLTLMSDFFRTTLMNTIDDHKISDVRILGDLFDNRNTLNVRTINTVLDIFNFYNINRPDVKFNILIGNHDQYYHNRSDINSINILKNIPNINIVDKICIEKINGKKIVMVPWLIHETETYQKFTHMTDGDEKFDLLLGHFEIRGFEVTPGIIDTTGLETNIFRNFKKVFSGHYHLRDTRGNLTYLGCPYQLSWGDYGNDKGIHIYDIDTEETIFIKNEDSPSHYKIIMSELANGDRECLKKVKNNIIRLVIDKKYKDQVILKVVSAIEALEPFKLDIDNQYIEEEVDTESVKNIDISRLNDPLSFLIEYIKIIELPTDSQIKFDKKELSNRVIEIYQKMLKEKD